MCSYQSAWFVDLMGVWWLRRVIWDTKGLVEGSFGRREFRVASSMLYIRRSEYDNERLLRSLKASLNGLL
jgi:hypothetical protein